MTAAKKLQRMKEWEAFLRTQRAKGGKPKQFQGTNPAPPPPIVERDPTPPGVIRRGRLYGMDEHDARRHYAGSRVGMMHFNGDITQMEANACDWFLGARDAVIRALDGPALDGSPPMERTGGRSHRDTSAADVAARLKWQGIRNSLLSVHPQCEHVLMSVIVDDAEVTPSTRQMWRAGLARLVAVYEQRGA